MERAVQLWSEADLIIHVLDGSVPLTEEDFQILAQTKDKHRVVVINKSDLPRVWDLADLPQADLGGAKIVEISLLEGELDPVVDAILDLVMQGVVREGTSSQAIITRARHKAALEQAKGDLEQALETLTSGLPLDLIFCGAPGSLGTPWGNNRETVGERYRPDFCPILYWKVGSLCALTIKIVVGAGHAGCEAAYAAAPWLPHLALTTTLDNIAQMPCNPATAGLLRKATWSGKSMPLAESWGRSSMIRSSI